MLTGWRPRPTTRVRTIFDLHDNQRLTLAEIGAHFGVSRERVRQILAENRDLFPTPTISIEADVLLTIEEAGQLSGLSRDKIRYYIPLTRRTQSRRVFVKSADLRAYLATIPAEHDAERARFMKKVRVTSTCWLWTGSTAGTGYGRFSFRGRKNWAHRASYRIFKGDFPDELWVLHHCDVPACVNPDHLFLGVPKDNTQDSIRKGRWMSEKRRQAIKMMRHNSARGANNKLAKLTWEVVRAVRRDYERGGISQAELGRRYDIPYQQIWQLVHYKRYLEVVQPQQ